MSITTAKYGLPGLLALIVVIIDQAAKWAVEAHMAWQVRYDLLPFFALFRTWNEGIAFSMLSGLGAPALIALAVAVSAFVSWLWWQSPAGRPLAHVGFALVIGGAVGNLIDRVRFGHVVDYFLFHLPQWSFAVFNLADAAITVGALCIIADELLGMRQSQADRPTPADRADNNDN